MLLLNRKIVTWKFEKYDEVVIREIGLMEYKLGIIDAIRAYYNPEHKIISIIVLVTIVIPLLLCVIDENFFIPLMIGGLFILIPYDNGWKIKEEYLQIRGCMISKKIKISSMQIALVYKDRRWNPYVRMWGIGLPGLASGYMLMENDKKAFIFHYQTDKVQLIICANQKYYSIAHAGVEELYEQLLKLGAKQENL